MDERQARIAGILDLAPVVPVLTVHDLDRAVPLARALVAGGLPVLEITLRTAVAVEAIRRIADAVPDAVVGAGTVLTPAQYTAVAAAGARFVVSPGHDDALLTAAARSPVPFLPGAATPSEAMRLLAAGYRHLKFFPAEPAGGTAMLGALAAPLADAVFCPTGGIDLAKAPAYLALPNVAAIGGSWVAPADATDADDWGRVEALAYEASRLPRPGRSLRSS